MPDWPWPFNGVRIMVQGHVVSPPAARHRPAALFFLSNLNPLRWASNWGCGVRRNNVVRSCRVASGGAASTGSIILPFQISLRFDLVGCGDAGFYLQAGTNGSRRTKLLLARSVFAVPCRGGACSARLFRDRRRPREGQAPPLRDDGEAELY